MADYNKRACDKLYEKHGELGATYFIKTMNFKEKFKNRILNIYSISFWTGSLFHDSPFRDILNGASLLAIGLLSFIMHVLISLFAVFLVSGAILYDSYRDYKLYRKYLEKEKKSETG